MFWKSFEHLCGTIQLKKCNEKLGGQVFNKNCVDKFDGKIGGPNFWLAPLK